MDALAGNGFATFAMDAVRLAPEQQARRAMDAKAARSTLGSQASDRLEQLAQSRNEVARLAIPLASGLGHRSLCTVDPFADELDVAALADELQPMLADPAIGEIIQRFETWAHEGWPSASDDALLQTLRRYNGAEFAGRDRAAHRPFIEASLRALPWVTVVDPLSVID